MMMMMMNKTISMAP